MVFRLLCDVWRMDNLRKLDSRGHQSASAAVTRPTLRHPTAPAAASTNPTPSSAIAARASLCPRADVCLVVCADWLPVLPRDLRRHMCHRRCRLAWQHGALHHPCECGSLRELFRVVGGNLLGRHHVLCQRHLLALHWPPALALLPSGNRPTQHRNEPRRYIRMELGR